MVGAVSGDERAGALSRLRFLFKAAQAGFRGYDLVIANHVALAPVALAINLVFGTPYWVACHCIEVWFGTSRYRQAALRKADIVMPVSLYTANVVQKLYGIQSPQLRPVYNAIPNSFAEMLTARDREKVSSTEGPQGPVLLSVCSLTAKNEFKGVDTVIRALPTILQAWPSLKYIVAGGGELRAQLENLALAAGVAANVNFTGEVSDSELAALYRQCDVFVLPSRGQGREGVEGGEGFGRVYLEAAMAGKPVVGSRSGGASEAVLHGQTGLLVNPESSVDVATALLAILGDTALAARLGSAGKAWACESFSEDAISNSLREMLRPYGFKTGSVPEFAHAVGRP
jgi:phosphatidylinositol alpha-1,6-mannosyltransferase